MKKSYRGYDILWTSDLCNNFSAKDKLHERGSDRMKRKPKALKIEC